MEQKILTSVAFRNRPEADTSVGESSKFKFRSASFAAATRACNGIRKRCHHLGPGLIAGAADDDPSGIATYSQVGAQFGYSLGWVLLLTGPFLVAIQEISARVGHVTAQGIAANIRQHQSAGLLRLAVLMLLAANIMNLGADIGAMGAALKLLIGGPEHAYAALFGVLCLLLMLFMSYMRYVAVLKWLCVSLLAYVASAIMVHVPWRAAASGMFIPSINFKLDYLTAVVALLGTTISPYVFFWQAQLEAENQRKRDERRPSRPDRSPAQLRRIRLDTLLGAGGAMLIALCIMGSAAATLNVTSNVSIQTSAQAAEALRPIAGDVAFALFAAGIIGTGMLAVPALAGSAAYALAEALGWPSGLARRVARAKAFYATLAIATLAGLAMNFSGVDPVRALYWSAVFNGLLAPPLMAMIIALASSPTVMGKFRISRSLQFVGWTATALMSLAAVGMFASLIANPS